MRKDHVSSASSRRSRSRRRPCGYLLPMEALVALSRTRDHLQLLSQLAAARIAYDADELALSADALACSFHRLKADLDEVLSAARFRPR